VGRQPAATIGLLAARVRAEARARLRGAEDAAVGRDSVATAALACPAAAADLRARAGPRGPAGPDGPAAAVARHAAVEAVMGAGPWYAPETAVDGLADVAAADPGAAAAAE